MAAVDDPMTRCAQDQEVTPWVKAPTPFSKLGVRDDMVGIDASLANLAVHGHVVSLTALAHVTLLALSCLCGLRVAALELPVPAEAALLLEIGWWPFRSLVAVSHLVDLFGQARVESEHLVEVLCELRIIWDARDLVGNGGDIAGFVPRCQWWPASSEVDRSEVKAVALG
jgi:hypothetical protein